MIWRAFVLITLLALVGAAEAAPGAGIELLGQPCRAKNVLSGCAVVDRADGRERFAVANMNETGGAEIIYIDFEKDTAKIYPSGVGQGSWGLMEIPGDRLLMPTYHQGWFAVFDLKKMEYIKTVEFKGEGYIWNAALGGDGRAYGGTYPGAKLCALNLDTYELEDCGAPMPENTYLRSVYSMPDGRILCSFGYVKNGVLIYDPKTKKFDPLPESMEGVSAGVAWQGYFLAGGSAYDGRTLQRVDPPYPPIPGGKGYGSVVAALTSDDTVYLQHGNSIYKWSPGDGEPALVADVDLREGWYLAAAKSGRLLGVRGQDYFVINPGDTSLNLKPIPAESGPRPTLFLRAAPDGILWGGPTFGQTLFSLDPKTRRVTNTRTISDKGGEAYDAAFYKGAVYAAAYSKGEIIRYDPREPWDQLNHKNPRTIAYLYDKGYIRPIGTIQLGPDGKLYSGWQAKYGTYGGAVAITDPETEQTELIENPLGEQAVAGIALGDGVVYAGTNLTANGLPPKTGEYPSFGIIDLASKQVVYRRVFEDAKSVCPIACDNKSGKVAVVTDGRVRIFDARVRGFADTDAPRPNYGSVAAPGDGCVYYGSGNSLICLEIAAGRHTTVVEAPDKVSSVAVDSKGRIYFSSGVNVYAVKK